MDYDELYGRVRVPHLDVKQAEKEYTPRSMQILNKQTAAALKIHMEAFEKLLIVGVIHQFIPILWLMRSDGEIAFAIEEVVEISDGSYCNVYNGTTNENEQKLGHPTLTGDREFQARIGGEILIDDNIWTITNASGRYCRPSDTTATHLNNISALFEGYGIVLKPNYRTLSR